jgi:hypothetical protein
MCIALARVWKLYSTIVIQNEGQIELGKVKKRTQEGALYNPQERMYACTSKYL